MSLSTLFSHVHPSKSLFSVLQKYKITEERKKAQLDVDKQLLAAIKASPTKATLAGYLKSKFGLSNKQYPHKMKF